MPTATGPQAAPAAHRGIRRGGARRTSNAAPLRRVRAQPALFCRAAPRPRPATLARWAAGVARPPDFRRVQARGMVSLPPSAVKGKPPAAALRALDCRPRK